MMRRPRAPLTPSGDYADEIEMLRQQVVTLSQRWQGTAPPPPSLAEAMEELSVAVEELQVVNEELSQTQQVAISHQLRYQELFEFAPDGYLVTDLDGCIQEANRAAAAMLNVGPQRMARKPLAIFIAPEERPSFRTQMAWLQNGAEVRHWGVRVQPRSRPAFPASVSVAPVRDPHGQMIGLRWLVRDITAWQQVQEALEHQVRERTAELAQANAALQAALDRAEMLSKELHHRVKNNLQVMANLLNLHSASLQDRHTQAIFQDCQERIRAMALVHELLYDAGDLGRIELGRYLTALAARLFWSYRIEPGRIALTIQADEVELDVHTAIPCGLLCHELLSNCLKHAFPEHRSGKVTITLRAVPAGQLTVIVRDTGIGFPAAVDFRRTESLGLRLVCTLTEQLRGTIALERHCGTCFTLTFPV
jgi:PAS domain S-box-containing protein